MTGLSTLRAYAWALIGGLMLGGVVLMVLYLLSPPQPVWIAVEQTRDEHVMSLGFDEGGLYAGTQSGRLWRQAASGGWERAAEVKAPITAIAAEPLLLGTGRGVLSATDAGWAADAEGHVLDLDVTAKDHWAVTSDQVLRRQQNGGWMTVATEALPEASFYRVLSVEHEQGRALYLGTIGAGVYTRLQDELGRQSGWLTNSEGLPAGIKVLALYRLPAGAVLAGTDQGLYRQDRPFEAWRAQGQLLQALRVLSLEYDGAWLWAGTDHGAYRTAFEQGRQVGPWHLIPAREPFERPVSAIQSADEALYIAAGTVYRLEQRRPFNFFRE